MLDLLDYFVYIMLVFKFALQLPQYPFPSLLFPSQSLPFQLSTYSLPPPASLSGQLGSYPVKNLLKSFAAALHPHFARFTIVALA